MLSFNQDKYGESSSRFCWHTQRSTCRVRILLVYQRREQAPSPLHSLRFTCKAEDF